MVDGLSDKQEAGGSIPPPSTGPLTMGFAECANEVGIKLNSVEPFS